MPYVVPHNIFQQGFFARRPSIREGTAMIGRLDGVYFSTIRDDISSLMFGDSQAVHRAEKHIGWQLPLREEHTC